MNIIKLKDKVMPDSISGYDFFNKYLKGKYAYWIQMRYIVPFEHMSTEGYVSCEGNIADLLPYSNGELPKPFGTQCLDSTKTEIIPYVDSEETDRINSIIEFEVKNTYTADDNITIDELKLFRSWLAKQLIAMSDNILLGGLDKHVLEYYANDMYDNTIKVLTDFGGAQVKLEKLGQTSCSCHGHNMSSLYDLSMDACNPIEVYRNNIYLKMVEMFGGYTFWTQWSPEFINEFKKYIDNIIKCNFPLSSTQWTYELVDCGCRDKTDQDKYIEILKRLSTALGYIRDEKVIGNKNFINDALYDWASKLYEKMSW